MFFHWKGEVRLSPPPSYVIRPGKSWENFNSKFSANLDFKEFELLSLNWQLVYIPWKIKGARKKSSLIWISRRFSVAIIVLEPIMDMPGKVTRWLTGWAIWHGGGGSSFTWKPRKTFQITIFRKNIPIAYLLNSVHLSICKVLTLVNGESGGSHQGKEGCCYRHHQCHSPYCNTREKVWKLKEKRKWKQKENKSKCCYRHHQCHFPYCKTREKVWKWKEKRKWK